MSRHRLPYNRRKQEPESAAMDRYVVAITWLRALKIWWAQTWRGFLLTIALALVGMFTYGFFSPLLRDQLGMGEVAIRLALTFAFVVYAFGWAMKRALQVRYADFVIEIAPVDPASPGKAPTTAGMTLWQAFAVLWAMFWRAWLIAFPLNLLTAYLVDGTVLPAATFVWANFIIEMIISVIVGAATCAWALRIALRLNYGTWRLQLVPTEQALASAPAVPADFGSATR
jgi:hypothetical protein